MAANHAFKNSYETKNFSVVNLRSNRYKEATGGNDMTRADKIRNLLKPLPLPQQGGIDTDSVCTGSYASETVADYLSFYGLDHEKNNPDVTHILGTFTAAGDTLVGHIYISANYTAVIVLMHGYLNHAGQFKHLIKYFTDKGYAVAHFDMQGHGLSSGGRAEIEDFSQYTEALNVFTEYITSILNGPYHLIGFSTGSAVVFDYTLAGSSNHYDKVILTAPLVHNVAWRWSRVGFKFYRPFIKKVPRVHRQNSHDEEFLYFNRNQDYLHSQEVPLKWVHALQIWNQRIGHVKPVEKPALIIQGTKDLVVDYHYNVEFIKQKLPATKVTYIEGAHHELFNESEPLRALTFEIIDEYLKQPSPA